MGMNKPASLFFILLRARAESKRPLFEGNGLF